MRKFVTGGLAVVALTLSTGLAAVPQASAQASSRCNYTTREPTVSYGSSGSAVKQVQCELWWSVIGSNLKRDGLFGSATLHDVKVFQGCAGLAQDGIVGPKTWAKLDYWTNAAVNVC